MGKPQLFNFVSIFAAGSIYIRVACIPIGSYILYNDEEMMLMTVWMNFWIVFASICKS